MRGKPFTKISTALDISTSTHETPQIVKFHGDFERDESIVLSESDYFERLDFESPVDIKFRADAFGKTILFIGYSLSDVNIRLLLYKIHKAWKISGFYEHRPESFVFMSKPDPIQEKVLHHWGLQTIVGDTDDPDDALRQFLGSLLDLVRGGKIFTNEKLAREL